MRMYDSARGDVQRRSHILQNDEGGIKHQVGRNVLSYVDGIVVASKKRASYISDLCVKPSSNSTRRSASSG
jgi:hypothetical protein